MGPFVLRRRHHGKQTVRNLVGPCRPGGFVQRLLKSQAVVLRPRTGCPCRRLSAIGRITTITDPGREQEKQEQAQIQGPCVGFPDEHLLSFPPGKTGRSVAAACAISSDPFRIAPATGSGQGDNRAVGRGGSSAGKPCLNGGYAHIAH